MKTYSIEVKNAKKEIVKRFNFSYSEDIAYAIFEATGCDFPSDHKLELSDRRTGKLLPEGRMSGHAEWCERK